MVGFQILAFLKIFVTDFSGTMNDRKLKVRISMNNDLMYGVYCFIGQGSITLGVMSLDRFSKFKTYFAYTLLCLWSYINETLPHLVSKVRKV